MVAKERIHNTKTNKYMRIRQRKSKNGRKGQIKDSWTKNYCKHKKK